MLAWLMNMGFAASPAGAAPGGLSAQLVGFIRNLGTLMGRR